jgi:hypothetical protein
MYFRKISRLARHTTLQGGHEIHEDNAAGVLSEIRGTLKEIRAHP